MKGFRPTKGHLRSLTLAACSGVALGLCQSGAAYAAAPATPIQHLVVIFQENISFDHYFATYPIAKNLAGEPSFTAAKGTPSVNGLTGALLTHNPNVLNPANAGLPLGAAPFRLDRSQAATCDQNHDYMAEQQAFDFGLMDAFPAFTGSGNCGGFDYGHSTGLVMGYFDGNTVTAFWNYAQSFAMSDNSYGTTFGPSTPGALNLISGQTGGVTATLNGSGDITGTTVTGDPDPIGDVCSNVTRNQVQLGGANIGNLLNSAGLTWGWFEGGFNLSTINPDGSTGCVRTHPSATGGTQVDYIPHHQPFQYYASTANPTHARPTATIGTTDAANHQYDIDDFSAALGAGTLPAVSFLKAAGWQDGHAGYSSPLNEQQFAVNTINALEASPFWSSTAVIIAYDDSDGWYDHQMSPIVNPSASTADALSGTGKCGNGKPGGSIEARCGYGPRLPLLVISPYAKRNFVDHAVTDQSSILKFVELNWSLGPIGGASYDALAGTLKNVFDFSQSPTRTLILDPVTGEPAAS
jgi:phospholipase C